MAENKIELKSVKELLGMKFFIPSYQRGYRWTAQQVKDLLNDVNEFIQNKNSDFYSLQPLVVKKRWPDKALEDIKEKKSIEEIENYINNCKWEVIDGQQRLTTIYIILNYLKSGELYDIDYQTREFFGDFLKTIKSQTDASKNMNEAYESIINDNEDFDNIDFYHVFISYNTIKHWFEVDKKDIVKKEDFKSNLLKNVKFIWYESVNEDPIKVFTRLNIGKIKLTNSELIKALMLNRSNFKEESSRHIQLRQQEIASEWDRIEYSLQNDEYWLFLREHENDYDKPTRIDYIFDLICEDDGLKVFAKENENKEMSKDSNEKNNVIGNDEYRTFRYFYEYFHKKENGEQIKVDFTNGNVSEETRIEKCWKEVKRYYQTFQEWFDDLILYHYVGYLRCPVKKNDTLIKIEDLVAEWKDGKDIFVLFLKGKIKERIDECKELNKQYEIGDNNPPKTTCKPLLLLHNIQTVINQNIELESKKEYGLPVFYKFPFHLYKKEKWDVEHIDSNTTNELEKEKDQKEWLKYSALDYNISINESLMKDIKEFLKNKSKKSFETLSEDIEKCILIESNWVDPDKDKNKIWNFVLLDAGTNRGYGNAIFPAKRRCIVGKDQGKRIVIDDDLNASEEKGEIAFVPPVTKNVFLKYYNTSVDDLRCWSKTDAYAYKQNILKTLAEFGVIDNQNI